MARELRIRSSIHVYLVPEPDRDGDDEEDTGVNKVGEQEMPPCRTFFILAVSVPPSLARFHPHGSPHLPPSHHQKKNWNRFEFFMMMMMMLL